MKPEKPFVRSPYNYDTNAAGDEDAIDCHDKSLTKQSFADESDINNIVKRFSLTGELPDNIRMPTYGDFSQVYDFHSAMNAVAQANEAFDAMPAHIRARFHNDAAEFVEFCSDDRNHEEAVKMGLARRIPPPIDPTEPTPPAIIKKPPEPPKGDPKE